MRCYHPGVASTSRVTLPTGYSSSATEGPRACSRPSRLIVYPRKAGKNWLLLAGALTWPKLGRRSHKEWSDAPSWELCRFLICVNLTTPACPLVQTYGPHRVDAAIMPVLQMGKVRSSHTQITPSCRCTEQPCTPPFCSGMLSAFRHHNLHVILARET